MTGVQYQCCFILEVTSRLYAKIEYTVRRYSCIRMTSDGSTFVQVEAYDCVSLGREKQEYGIVKIYLLL